MFFKKVGPGHFNKTGFDRESKRMKPTISASDVECLGTVSADNVEVVNVDVKYNDGMQTNDVTSSDKENKFDVTEKDFSDAFKQCFDIFSAKLGDYGPSWRIMRSCSVTDQIYIKANRIRNLEMNSFNSYVGDGVLGEFQAIVNYGIVGLIQLRYGYSETPKDMANEEAEELYKTFARQAYEIMCKKNRDYNEAWKLMRIYSYTDFILMKLFRVMEIESHNGKTKVSEPIDSNYIDIINYAIFGIIKLSKKGY